MEAVRWIFQKKGKVLLFSLLASFFLGAYIYEGVKRSIVSAKKPRKVRYFSDVHLTNKK